MCTHSRLGVVTESNPGIWAIGRWDNGYALSQLTNTQPRAQLQTWGHSTTNTQPRAQLQVLVKASDDFEHAIFLKFRIGVSLWVEDYSHAL